jgi:hypothetical protein
MWYRGVAAFWQINGVFHCAGVLKDQLIALRAPCDSQSAVLSIKAKGASVLQSLFVDGDLDFMIHFFGQLDPRAAGRLTIPPPTLFWTRWRRLTRLVAAWTRTISINWNAWKEVGMLATLVRERSRPTAIDLRAGFSRRLRAGRRRQTLFHCASPRTHWPLGEHVVRAGRQ